jgi:hypothetical protein
MDFRTEKERAKQEERQKICKAYKEIAPAVIKSGHRPWRAIKIVAQQFDRTPVWIATILNHNGLYQNAEKEYKKYNR